MEQITLEVGKRYKDSIGDIWIIRSQCLDSIDKYPFAGERENCPVWCSFTKDGHISISRLPSLHDLVEEVIISNQ